MTIFFRKRLHIMPGVTLNFSRKGATSVSIGPRGAKINLSARGATARASVSGLSWRQRLIRWSTGK